jgi:esterase/lipase superfamily enzyme
MGKPSASAWRTCASSAPACPIFACFEVQQNAPRKAAQNVWGTMSGWTKRAGAAAVAAALAGCMPSVGDMSSSVASTVTTAGGLLAAPQGQPRPIMMFVASTRQAEKGALAESIGPTKYGFDVVTTPPGHEAGVIEQPRWGSADPMRHIALRQRSSLDQDEFFQQIATNLSGRVGSNRDVLIFVHGFNNGPDYARLRFAQIVADSHFGGVPVLFTWPSRQKLLAYGSDREAATQSRDPLEKLLRGLAATPGVGRVHVMAHSMGTWLAMETLRQVSIAGDPTLGGKLGEIMLAAPDLDLGVFEQQMARLPGARVSVFAASNDRALSLSSTLSGRARLGAVDASDPRVRLALESMGVKVYDVTADASGLIRHDAFAEAPQVVGAIGARLAEPRVEDRAAQSIIGQKPEPYVVRPAIESAPLAAPVAQAPAPVQAGL